MGAIKIKGATSGSTTITAPATGSDESIELSTVLAGKLDLAGGKILQIVRATDSTERSTTSTSYVDVTGMSVTITPQKSDSVILLVNTCRPEPPSNAFMRLQITDNSNNPISGAENNLIGGNAAGTMGAPITQIAYATPATTSAVTYKVRFLVTTGSGRIKHDEATGQLYAIEVSA